MVTAELIGRGKSPSNTFFGRIRDLNLGLGHCVKNLI